MDLASIHNVSVLGIQRGLTEIRRSANEVARAGTTHSEANTIDLAKELVNIKEQKNVVVANVDVIKTESEVLGTILDIFV